jgi:hypothetical protein
MAVWREPVLFSDVHVFPTRERRVAVVIRHHHLEDLGCELFYRRWEGPEELPPYGPFTARRRELCAEYWPRAPDRYDTLAAASERAREIAPLSEAEFDRRQCRPAFYPVDEVNGPEERKEELKAWIFRHPGERYEVCCYQYEPIAQCEDGTCFEWEWVRIPWDYQLFASDLTAAKEAARRELDLLAQSVP